MNIPLDWIGTVFNLTGCVFNAKKNILCWPIWLIGNGLWVFHWWPKNEWAAVFLTIVYAALNIYGYRSWKKHETD